MLTRLQPENGGFLEAAPLTSFVVMSLAASGHAGHEVTRKGVEFLAASMREDGSWPIDTNLATWVTTLSINTLSEDFKFQIRNSDLGTLASWLLSCQHRDIHPYTHAEPGGWGWSNLPGAVPDGDDTAGALIALHTLLPNFKSQISNFDFSRAVGAGVEWLLGLQNADGGIPTFCRGWTKLPFDKSTPDITAHALGAMSAWLPVLPAPLRRRTEEGISRALRYLRDAQRGDGSWTPLWFGNQHTPNQENPVYGTSRALTHLSNFEFQISNFNSLIAPMCERAIQWLLSAENSDGGWGGDASAPSSIEETALAVDALASAVLHSAFRNPHSTIDAVRRGADWLITNTRQGQSTPASPIGLYFARLWYFEELYPLVFAFSALSKVQRLPEDLGGGAWSKP